MRKPPKVLNRIAWLDAPSSRERSKAQEKRLSKVSGGQVQRASGATQGRKGDVIGIQSIEDIGRGFLFEAKITKHNSYSLNLYELRKIEAEAFNKGKLGAMEITFEDKHAYIVVRRDFIDFGRAK